MIFERFWPDRLAHSIRAIDFKKEYADGVRGVIFDIDNTLVAHGAPANPETVRFFTYLRSLGLKTCLISNNDEKRVQPFAKRVGAKYLHKAGKPGKRGYLHAMRLMHTNRKNTLFVGDQILTDVYGAKRAGMRNIMVRPVDADSEPWRIRLKRRIERVIMAHYREKTKTQLDT